VEGRLTLEEFSDRVSRAQAARTDRELTVDLPALPSRPAPQAAPARYRATFAKLVRRGAWEIPAHSKWRCLCGTIVLDLREGRLPGPEVELEIYNSFGTVTVLVPAGIAVEVEGGGMFASQVLEPPAWPPPPGAPRLKIRVAGSGGTLRIRSSVHRHSPGEPLAQRTGRGPSSRRASSGGSRPARSRGARARRRREARLVEAQAPDSPENLCCSGGEAVVSAEATHTPARDDKRASAVRPHRDCSWGRAITLARDCG